MNRTLSINIFLACVSFLLIDALLTRQSFACLGVTQNISRINWRIHLVQSSNYYMQQLRYHKKEFDKLNSSGNQDAYTLNSMADQLEKMSEMYFYFGGEDFNNAGNKLLVYSTQLRQQTSRLEQPADRPARGASGGSKSNADAWKRYNGAHSGPGSVPSVMQELMP